MGRIVAVALAPWGDMVPVSNSGRVGGLDNIQLEDYLHSPDKCEGEWCCLHHPSEHPLKDADMVLRLDKHALVERLCEHGIGHDDPDSLAWLIKHEPSAASWVHGCDGCCHG